MYRVALEPEIFLGRSDELARLCEAIRKRESLLVWGPTNSGKSTLVSRAVKALPERIVKSCICTTGAGSPQEILRRIACALAEDPLFSAKFGAETKDRASFPQWVHKQTSLRLRGLLYRAAGAGEYWIFLEDTAPMTHALTRIVKELMINQETPIYCVAPGWTHRELGHGAKLYWNDQQRLHVGPVPLAEANRLLDWAIRKFGLAQFDLDGFREDILQFSGLLPGAILRMCEAAMDSHYHFEGRIKTKLLHVDYLMKHCNGIAQNENRSNGD
jgi:energy-coupling factor transporter ATP-binding protein EcfA2